MSSEAITQNDLREILSRTVGSVPSEFKKLIWTNPNPTTAFSAQTISLDLSNYDTIEVHFKTSTTSAYTQYVLADIGNSSKYLNRDNNANNFYVRVFSTTTSSVQFDSGYYQGTANNIYGIPLNIYGIKYERVEPPQVEFEWEEITPLTVTVTTGSSGQQLHAYKRGRMLFFSLTNISRAANTSSGSNFWVANVSGLPASFINSVGCGYYDEKNIFVHFQSTSETTAKLTARVTGGTLNANSAVGSITTMTLFSS